MGHLALEKVNNKNVDEGGDNKHAVEKDTKSSYTNSEDMNDAMSELKYSCCILRQIRNRINIEEISLIRKIVLFRK